MRTASGTVEGLENSDIYDIKGAREKWTWQEKVFRTISEDWPGKLCVGLIILRTNQNIPLTSGVGQDSLFNVMKAYSILHREVGYYQGSAFIVGLLLREMPEEDSFAVLVKIMEDYRMREMFKPSMAELGLCMYQLDTLVQEHIPDLHVHFQSQAIHTNLYASSWFLTLFTTSLPLILSCRVMHCFLSEGMEGILVLSRE
eukprot:GFUD01059730.1.p1 GENE.GFUD01059730.1~~GFUD01059730.1.p1  ORF type:complete len:200 (+),score=55.06 GFUD01059730.1:273-872(+)